MKALPKPGKYPALQLVLPTHWSLGVVDLMAVRRDEGEEPELVMAAQQRKEKNPSKAECLQRKQPIGTGYGAFQPKRAKRLKDGACHPKRRLTNSLGHL